MTWTKESNLKIGDLVYHILHGKSWMAVIISFDESPKEVRRRALVHMVPGTEHQRFFANRISGTRIGSCKGWVSENWLVKINSQNS